MKTLLITGGSKGLGNELTLKFLSEGWKVINISRTDLDGARNKYYQFYECDLSDIFKVEEVIKNIIKKEERIDVVINNAGSCVYGPLELHKTSKIVSEFNINVISQIIIVKYIIPILKPYSKIVGIGSVAGLITSPFCSIQHSNKFALEGFYESLYQEMIPLKIKVQLYELNSLKTKMLEKTFVYDSDKKEYFNRSKENLNICKNNYIYNLEPSFVARKIFQNIIDSDQFRFYIGKDIKEFYLYELKKDEKKYLHRFYG